MEPAERSGPLAFRSLSHQALASLLEERGFEVLAVGLDVCTRPPPMRAKVDEHYHTIELSYVVGRKL